MSLPRFYVPDLAESPSVVLEPGDAMHAFTVLRLSRGSAVSLFDGQGGQASGHIESISKRSVTVKIQHRSYSPTPATFRIELFVALPKGDRQRQLVDALNQLGVDALTPIICARGVALPGSGAMQRLQRAVIESCKQCRRDQLMAIHEPLTIQELSSVQRDPTTELSLFAHPSTALNEVATYAVRQEQTLRCAVGPEGGFSDEETSLLGVSGWHAVSLGNYILRIETAAIAMAAFFSLHRPVVQREQLKDI